MAANFERAKDGFSMEELAAARKARAQKQMESRIQKLPALAESFSLPTNPGMVPGQLVTIVGMEGTPLNGRQAKVLKVSRILPLYILLSAPIISAGQYSRRQMSS